MHIAHSILLAAAFHGSCALGQEGQLDLSFGVNGIASLAVGTVNLLENDMVVQNDGKILTTGRCSDGQGWDIYVMRCMPDGDLDATFGDQGFVRTDLGTFWDQAFAITVDGEGRVIVAAESFSNPFAPQVCVVRYLANGTLDGVFGSEGIANAPLDALGHPCDLTVNGNGAIIVVGTDNAYSAIVVYQFTGDGALDSGFGSGGATTAAPFGSLNMAKSVFVQDDGRLVLACTYGQPGAYDVGVVRLFADGAFDPSFGSGGIATLSVSPADETIGGLGIQSDGGVIIAGSSDNAPNYDVFVARFTVAGNLDPEFGVNGVRLVSVQPGLNRANDLAIQSDDKIVLAGRRDIGPGTSAVTVFRLNANGGLDAAFGASGIVTTALSGVASAAGNSVGLQPDGRVVVAASGGEHPMLLRYLAGPFIGVEENSGLGGGMMVFPNPVGEQAVLHFELGTMARIACDLLDVQGRSVRRFFDAQRSSGHHRDVLDMSDITPGHYTLAIRSAAGTRHMRLVRP